MHEMSIANSLLDSVRTEALRFPDKHIAKVGVRIGALAGVDPEALRFCFEVFVKDSDMEPLELDIDYRARRHECLVCGESFDAAYEDTPCPRCGAADSIFISGDELELAYLEVEDAPDIEKART
jgi:hydrogenase nickel incorporation protein HypA/HybF